MSEVLGQEPVPEQMLPGSSSLAILLILFFGMALLALVSIMLGRPEGEAANEVATVAYSPADFPEILNEDFTKGLDVNSHENEFQVPPPPFSKGIYPCQECHSNIDPNPKVRKLEDEHLEIKLNHGKDRWCLDCHDLTDRNKLRLANGTLVPFEESYRLCGQCHGDKFRDWKAGIHGKRTGYWNGPKRYLLCAHCHNPHAPHFAPIKPLPPPVRPQYQQAPQAQHSQPQ